MNQLTKRNWLFGSSKNFKDIFRDSGSALILLNKLVEDKRYDDAVKIFEYGIQRGFNTTSGRAYPTDVVMLAIEGLYRQVRLMISEWNKINNFDFLEYKTIVRKSKRISIESYGAWFRYQSTYSFNVSSTSYWTGRIESIWFGFCKYISKLEWTCVRYGSSRCCSSTEFNNNSKHPSTIDWDFCYILEHWWLFRLFVMLKWVVLKKQSMLFIYLQINHRLTMIVDEFFHLWYEKFSQYDYNSKSWFYV